MPSVQRNIVSSHKAATIVLEKDTSLERTASKSQFCDYRKRQNVGLRSDDRSMKQGAKSWEQEHVNCSSS